MESIIKVKIKNRIFRIKDCKFSSMRGLMFDSLQKYDGALIYAQNRMIPSASMGIWMLFVKHSLDLIFLDGNFRIIDFQKAVPIKLFNRKTWKIYKCDKARYCLELNAGLIKIGKGKQIHIVK